MNGKFNPKRNTVRACFSKIRTLYSIFKKDRGGLPSSPGCAPVSVAEYAPISLRALNMHYHLTCSADSGSKEAWVLNVARLYVKGLRKVMNMSAYGSIRLNNAWIYLTMPYYPLICLNIAEYFWMSLHMPENDWINCSDFQGSQYAVI